MLLISPGRTLLMQHRAEWTAHPLTWGVPGGACDSHETPEVTALREAGEEAGITEAHVEILDVEVTTGPYPADPARPELAGGWQYHTVYALAAGEIDTVANEESLELRWVPFDQVAELELLPAFAQSWPAVRARRGIARPARNLARICHGGGTGCRCGNREDGRPGADLLG